MGSRGGGRSALRRWSRAPGVYDACLGLPDGELHVLPARRIISRWICDQVQGVPARPELSPERASPRQSERVAAGKQVAQPREAAHARLPVPELEVEVRNR